MLTGNKRTTTDLLEQQNVADSGSGRNKRENHLQEAVVKRPQNKENVEPQVADEDDEDEDNDKISSGNNEDEFGPLLRAPKKRPGKRTRKRAKKNKQQGSGITVTEVGLEAVTATVTNAIVPRPATIQDKLTKNLSAATVTGDGGSKVVKSVNAEALPPQHTGSDQRACLSEFGFTDLQIWYMMNEYAVPQAELYLCGMPVSFASMPGHAIFFRTNMRQKKLNPVAKEFNLAEPSTSASVHEPPSPTQDRDGGGDNDVQQQQQQQQQQLQQQFSFHDLVSCVRCSSFFSVNDERRFAEKGRCLYHYGKLLFHKHISSCKYDCCGRLQTSQGCTKADCHVWNGFTDGHNGPMPGFVRTYDEDDTWSTSCSSSSASAVVSADSANLVNRVYGIDCEMCYTEYGLEATKVTLVDLNGAVVYDSLIRPSRPIVDYNTRFSGITVKDFKPGSPCKSLAAVQRDLLRYIRHDTILVGHGLGSDLLALRMIHQRVVDTTLLFPADPSIGGSFKRSLKSLAFTLLHRTIQHAYGHDSVEDARAAIDVTLFKLYKDYISGKFTRLLCVLRLIPFHLHDQQRQQQQLQHHYQQQQQQQQLQHRQNRRGRRRRGCGGGGVGNDDDDDSSSGGGGTSSSSSSVSYGSITNVAAVGQRA